MIVLNPCPFCGGPAEAQTDEYRQRFVNEFIGTITDPSAKNAWIICTVCGARGRIIHDGSYDGFKDPDKEERMKLEAAEAWNKRRG